jgi:hypothetical protein
MQTSEHFDALRSVDADASFPAVRAWLARSAAAPARRAPARPRPLWRRAALGGGVLVLVAACTVPITHDETVAYVVSGRIAQPPFDARPSLAALPWVDPARLSVLGEVMARLPSGEDELQMLVGSGRATVNGRPVITATSQFAIVVPRGRPEEVEAWTRALRAMPRVLSATAAPVEQKVRRPMLQAALVSMEMETEPKQDERVVEERIRSHLEGLQMSGIKVTHVTRPDGTRSIRLSGPGMASGNPEAGRRVNAFLRDVERP